MLVPLWEVPEEEQTISSVCVSGNPQVSAFTLSACGQFACLVSRSSEVLLGSLPTRHDFQNSRLEGHAM